jgi:hypothetical protein
MIIYQQMTSCSSSIDLLRVRLKFPKITLDEGLLHNDMRSRLLYSYKTQKVKDEPRREAERRFDDDV